MKYEKISKYVRSGPPATEKLDMEKPPLKQTWYVKLILALIAFTGKFLYRGKIKKVRMEGVKPPYVLFCNHNSPLDYFIMYAATAFQTGVYAAAPNVFLFIEKLIRKLGCMPTRKFTTDISLIRSTKRIVEQGNMMCIFVEARHCLCGKTEVIPDSVGQMAKRWGVPIVTLKMCGHHIANPFWNVASHRFEVPVEATMTQIFTPEEIKEATVEEINEKLRAHLAHDDFRWQSENRKKLKNKKRAEGLHKVLYQCPACGVEHQMDSEGAQVFCKACGKRWTLNYYGELEADSGETEFKFPTDWYDWEREQVRAEIESGNYYFESDVIVDDLPNSKGFVRIGKGRLVHDMNGFSLHGVRDYDGEAFEMVIPAAGQYACHVEFNHKFGNYRDCVSLNTLDDTWFVYPDAEDFSGTKMSLAVEEIFKKITAEKKAAMLARRGK